ncbi:hypothetical protein ACLB2K_010795 [Fragaria x ananassa]
MAPERQSFSFCIVIVLSFITKTSCHGGILPWFHFNNVSGARPSTPAPISVDKFGAKGIDHTGDTEAFEKAWAEACSSNGKAVLLLPPHRSYFVKPVTFSGAKCKAHHLTMQIQGTIMEFEDPKTYHFPNENKVQDWLTFESVESLVVEGPGTINGNGEKWWQSSCKQNSKTQTREPHCNKDAPTAVTFKKCNNLTVNNLNIEKAQRMHVTFKNCTNVKASGLGDDCISIIGGSRDVQATNITCGPGHGISIGSLGKGGSEDHVSDVTVDGAKLTGTMYGVRIKTWPGGSGYANRIIFQNIQMENVTDPIIIDQNYCNAATKVTKGECKPPPVQKNTAVQVRNVMYRNIKGTVSKDGKAIVFNCSSVPGACELIDLEDIRLEKGGAAVCSNVKPTYSRVDLPLNRCPN